MTKQATKGKRKAMETKSETKKSKPSISFHVFRKDGSKNPDIKAYFLENMSLTAHDAIEGKLILSDNTEWTLVLEPAVIDAIKSKETADCLISFQARHSGNFAVARLYNPEYKATKAFFKHDTSKPSKE